MSTDQPQKTSEDYRYSRLVAMSREDAETIVKSGTRETARAAEAAAKLGIVDAQLVWAQMLLSGTGTRQDAEAAFRWFKVAAAAKRPDTLNMLGRCYELGCGVEIDYAEAARLYEEAAAKGYDWAMFNLATLLFSGAGVRQSYRDALALYVRAARLGHAKAMTVIGRFREEGWSVSQKPSAARRWYAWGARGGDFRAHYRLWQLSVMTGERESGLAHLTQAIDGAYPEFCRDIAPDLLADSDGQVRSLGQRALERAGATRKSDELRQDATVSPGARQPADAKPYRPKPPKDLHRRFRLPLFDGLLSSAKRAWRRHVHNPRAKREVADMQAPRRRPSLSTD